MSLRVKLKFILIYLGLFGALSTFAQEQKNGASGSPISPLNLAVSYPRSFTFAFASVLDFQSQASAATKGKLSIRVLGSGEMLPAFGVLEAVQRGTVPMAWTAPHFFFGRDPMFGLIGQPLFSFTPRTYVEWRQRPDVSSIVDAFYKQYGIRGTLCGMVADSSDVISRIPLRSLQEIQASKLSAGAVYAKALRHVGVLTQSIPRGDLAAALKFQTIEGAEALGARDMADLQLGSVAKYLYHPSNARAFVANDLWISRAVWNLLDAPTQHAIDQACAKVVSSSLERTAEQNRAALNELESAGVSIQPLPSEIQESMKAGWLRFAFGEASTNEAYRHLLVTIPNQ